MANRPSIRRIIEPLWFTMYKYVRTFCLSLFYMRILIWSFVLTERIITTTKKQLFIWLLLDYSRKLISSPLFPRRKKKKNIRVYTFFHPSRFFYRLLLSFSFFLSPFALLLFLTFSQIKKKEIQKKNIQANVHLVWHKSNQFGFWTRRRTAIKPIPKRIND